VISGEPFENIAVSETHEKDLIINSPVTFGYSKMRSYEIVVTGMEKEGAVSIRAEELKGTSKLVAQEPPGNVYRNFNVWSSSRKIKDALIRYRVENSWLTSNNLVGSDVKILRWSGGKWVQLETGEIKKDDTYTYFETKTEGFSHFAVSALKGEAVPTATTTSTAGALPTSVQTAAAQAPGTTQEAEPLNLILIIGVLAVLVVVVAVYSFTRKKKGD